MKNILIITLLVLAFVFLPFLGACSKSATITTSTIPETSAPVSIPSSSPLAPLTSSPVMTQASSTSTVQPSETQTLKIGVITFFGASKYLDMVRGYELMADMDNKNGGWDIGGEKYQIQLVEYDSNNSQTSEASAVNKLIFEDKVKFIIGKATYGNTWLSTTEANKVIAMSASPNYTAILDPQFKYSFEPSCNNVTSVETIGWLCKNYPDLAKNIVDAFPDNQMGHMISIGVEAIWKSFGATQTSLYYPFGQTDLSSLGTKVKTLNPSVFEAIGGGDEDYEAFKAAYNAGYRGQLFASVQDPAMVLVQSLPAEALEGLICGGLTTEFEPAITQPAKDFKEAWIAKYGKWEDPDIGLTAGYACLKTALEKTGSLDTDKVAATISDGMKFEGVLGAAQMISRPDLGNARTVDSVGTCYMKVMKGGQPTLLATIGIDEGISYFRMAFPPK